MRLLVPLAALLLLMAGCAAPADVAVDHMEPVAQETTYEDQTFTAGPAMGSGPWDLQLDVDIDGPWLDLVGFLEISLYSGNYDLELIMPDGSVRDACGPLGCNTGIAIGSRIEIASGLGEEEPAQPGTMTVHAWGTGVGEATIGLDARVPT